MTFEATIEGWHPRFKLNGGHHNKYKSAANKRGDGYDAWLNARGNGWQFIPGKVRLEIVLVYPRKFHTDTDNLYARAKGIVDGLKGADGFFEDDRSEVLDLYVTTEVQPGRKATILKLSPYNGGTAE